MNEQPGGENDLPQIRWCRSASLRNIVGLICGFTDQRVELAVGTRVMLASW